MWQISSLEYCSILQRAHLLLGIPNPIAPDADSCQLVTLTFFSLMEWIDLIRPQAFWVTSQGAQCTDLTSKHGEFFGNHREEPIELGVDKHVINASLSGINRHINKQNMGSNKQKHSQTNIICRVLVTLIRGRRKTS